MEITSLVVSGISIIATVFIYFRSVVQLRRAIGLAFDMDVRRLINRIERNKEQFRENNPAAYKELFDVQDELETISKKFLTMFDMA